MKKKRKFILFFAAYLVLSLNNTTVGYSQGIDLYGKKEAKLYLGFSISPSQTSIENTISGNSSFTFYQLNSSKKFSFSGSLDAGYKFSRNFGIETGIGLSSFAADFSLDSCKNIYAAVDEDSENYERRITGENVTELQKILFMNIPLSAKFFAPLSDKLEVFVQAGLSILFPVSKSYSDKGTFTYTGYYPAYNITLYDVYTGSTAFEGFLSNQSVNESGELSIKTVNAGLISSAGVQYKIGDKYRLCFGVFYNRMFSNISDYSVPETFKFSDSIQEINSIMELSTKTTAQSYGLKISFLYFLK